MRLAFDLVCAAFALANLALLAAAVVQRARRPSRRPTAHPRLPAGLDLFEIAALQPPMTTVFTGALVDLVARGVIGLKALDAGEFELHLRLGLRPLSPLELRFLHVVFGPDAADGQRRVIRAEGDRHAFSRWHTMARRVQRATLHQLRSRGLAAARQRQSEALAIGLFAAFLVALTLVGLPSVLWLPFGPVQFAAIAAPLAVLIAVRLFGLRLTDHAPTEGDVLATQLAGVRAWIAQSRTTGTHDGDAALLAPAILWGAELSWVAVLDRAPSWWTAVSTLADLPETVTALGNALVASALGDGTEPGDPPDDGFIRAANAPHSRETRLQPSERRDWAALLGYQH